MSEMDRKDYADIVEHLKARLEEHGLQDIARDEHYIKSDGDDIYRLPPPKIHTLELLEAFRRHVTMNSLEAYDKAMEKIRTYTRNEGPEGFYVTEFNRFDSTDDFPSLDDKRLSLSEAPSRKKLIEQIDTLLINLGNPFDGGLHE